MHVNNLSSQASRAYMRFIKIVIKDICVYLIDNLYKQ